MNFKNIWNSLLNTGTTKEYSSTKIKRIRLTNGFALLTGIIALIVSVTAVFVNFITSGNIDSTRVSAPVGALLGLSISCIIFVNFLKKHLLASYLILIIWWGLLTSFSILYGQAIGFDRYFMIGMILPLAMFEKKLHVALSISISVLLFSMCQLFYWYYPPVIETPASFIPVRYAIHTIFLIATLISTVMYFRIQNIRNEKIILNEVNVRHAAQIKLEEVNYAKDRFFSVLAHDLQGSIGNFYQTFNDIELSEISPEMYEHLKKSTENTYELLQDLLLWARNQKNLIEFKPQKFNLLPILHETANHFSIQLKDKEIEIKINNHSDEPIVSADISSIKTVTRNLISNAIKFSHKGGIIKISVENHDGCIKTTIRDYGVGIDKSKIQTLFDLDKSTHSSPGTQNEKGTGLGLVLCKDFIEANKGQIYAENKNGYGACFCFTLPSATEKN